MAKGIDDDKTTPFIREEGDPVLPPGSALPNDPFRTAPTKPHPIAMFGAYAAAKNRKMPVWAMPLIAFVVIFHVGFLGVSWASSIWKLERLDRPKGTALDIAIAPAPPPPPPPPPGGAKPQTQTITPKKKTVKDIVQQVKIEKQQETHQEEAGDPNGEEGGEVGGVAGGVAGGVITEAPPPPPPPPPPAPPQNVPPTLLEGSRIAGEKDIRPSDPTKTEIQRSGKDKIVGSYKLCITVDGAINTISQLKSTGFPAYDGKIQSEMRSWRYRPYMVNGRAVPVCTAVTFIYTQK